MRQTRVPALNRFLLHYGAISSYVRRLGNHDAADVVAQVFSVAWRRFEVVPNPPAGRLWPYGVARRMVADHRRSSLRRQRLGQRPSAQPLEANPASRS